DRLVSLALLDMSRHTMAQAGENLPGGLQNLVNRGLRGQEGSMLVKQGSTWELALETPVLDATGQVTGVLVETQFLDNYFASDLTQKNGLDVIICQGEQILGTSERTLTQSLPAGGAGVCTPGAEQRINGSQHYLTLCAVASAASQLPGTPHL